MLKPKTTFSMKFLLLVFGLFFQTISFSQFQKEDRRHADREAGRVVAATVADGVGVRTGGAHHRTAAPSATGISSAQERAQVDGGTGTDRRAVVGTRVRGFQHIDREPIMACARTGEDVSQCMQPRCCNSWVEFPGDGVDGADLIGIGEDTTGVDGWNDRARRDRRCVLADRVDAVVQVHDSCVHRNRERA